LQAFLEVTSRKQLLQAAGEKMIKGAIKADLVSDLKSCTSLCSAWKLISAFQSRNLLKQVAILVLQ
jgi:hypothetical protein